MLMHKIEVDDDVFIFLKAHAEPFLDTPNSVLRKLLFRVNEPKNATLQVSIIDQSNTLPDLPEGIPMALKQILEVCFFVRKKGRTRLEATKTVAGKYGVFPQTVQDKYCRQLGLSAIEFDSFLKKIELGQLISLLSNKFMKQEKTIKEYFDSKLAPDLSDEFIRNSACPCGSGKKIRRCCLNKNDININEEQKPPEVRL